MEWNLDLKSLAGNSVVALLQYVQVCTVREYLARLGNVQKHCESVSTYLYIPTLFFCTYLVLGYLPTIIFLM